MLSGRFAQVMEMVSLALIVLGTIALCQPWVFVAFRYSFTVLLIGVVSFTFFSHRRPLR